MTTYTVRLTDDTVGKIDSDDRALAGRHADDCIGEIVIVHLSDENGMPIEVRGELAEVLAEGL